jgi:hypothetical protein
MDLLPKLTALSAGRQNASQNAPSAPEKRARRASGTHLGLTERFALHLTGDMLYAMQEAARAEEVSLAAWARAAMRAHLDRGAK